MEGVALAELASRTIGSHSRNQAEEGVVKNDKGSSSNTGLARARPLDSNTLT
jgi:hypothetical protein